MAKILLGVTGSVAALKTPELFERLRAAGHLVKVVATQSALYFFDPAALGGGEKRNPEVVILDEDEWPGLGSGQRWQRDEPVLHIELRRWADLFLIAPLDANTLAKLACGLCDNCLTCVWRAWDPARPVVLAPAMNTFMWDHPLTERHLGLLNQLGADFRPRIVPPVSKQLACGAVGVGAMADVAEIVAGVQALLKG